MLDYTCVETSRIQFITLKIHFELINLFWDKSFNAAVSHTHLWDSHLSRARYNYILFLMCFFFLSVICCLSSWYFPLYLIYCNVFTSPWDFFLFLGTDGLYLSSFLLLSVLLSFVQTTKPKTHTYIHTYTQILGYTLPDWSNCRIWNDSTMGTACRGPGL